MKIGPKYKIAKRLGASVFPKTQTQKFAISSERSARNKQRGRGGATEFGKQLLEKQKVRLTYGISEKQFRNAVDEAMRTSEGNPAEVLHRLLELRLDNVVYRIGLAPSRRSARQMVSHGHITVNGRKTTIPSRRVSLNDRIGVREGSRANPTFVQFAETFIDRPLPSWLSFNPKSMEGGLQKMPTMEITDTAGDLRSVISFYSR